MVFQEDIEHLPMRNDLINYISLNGSWLKIVDDRMPDKFDFTSTEFKADNRKTLQSMAFENYFAGFIATCTFLKEAYYQPV